MDLALYVPKAPSTESEREHWDKNMQLVLDVVTGEDFPAGRTIQIGLNSGAQTHTVYGRNEPAMIHYHQSMLKALGGSAALPQGAGSSHKSVRCALGERSNRRGTAIAGPALPRS
jgi:hypothetical protein